MSNAQILVVEDNSNVATDIQRRLKSLGYNVPTVVSTGENALKVAATRRPDLVLMDIMLKGNMDGMETAKKLSANNIPVIYLTAYSDPNTLERAKATGPYGYLLKPFNETELHTTIEIALYKHRMERKLQHSEQWLSTTLNSIGEAVISTDMKGTIVSMNPVAEALTGWSSREASRKNISEVFRTLDQKSRSPLESPLKKVITEKAAISNNVTTLLVTKGGKEIPIENNAAPIKSDDGSVTGVVVVFRDIAARMKAEDEIRRLNDELRRRVNELTAVNKELGTFNYSVSHDLRAPLIAIDAFSRILQEDFVASLDPEAQKHLQSIRANTRNMLQLIDDLLSFTRLSRSQIEKVDIQVAAQVKSVFDELMSSHPNRKISLKLLPLPDVRGDRAMIRQVFVNLLSNAIKFTRNKEHALIEVGCRGDSCETVYFVKDNGVGFDPKDTGRLFNVFQRLHSPGQFEGTGVGLAIVHRIIERHGGRLWAEGKIDKGATFCFTLPDADPGTNPTTLADEE
ncbi:MAG: response regulator [Ignavibacteriae bacterium]|nr:response regulator [Ignavibacteriota bacterium]